MTRCNAPRRAERGFTLMESLVVLVLISLSVMVMFQMLGSYRLAQERVALHAGGIDRQALVSAWFTDSVRGLQALEKTPLEGREDRFSGVTLNPLVARAGALTPVEWRIEPGRDGTWSLAYAEDGVDRWTLPLRDAARPRFAYYSRDGRRAARWPPESGFQDLLPGAVALEDGSRAQVASVLGPVRERVDPWALEEE
jgi:prepilin-type N-terminal cleavage/methylation domain-containing protein